MVTIVLVSDTGEKLIERDLIDTGRRGHKGPHCWAGIWFPVEGNPRGFLFENLSPTLWVGRQFGLRAIAWFWPVCARHSRLLDTRRANPCPSSVSSQIHPLFHENQ